VDFSLPWIDGKDFNCKVVDTGNLDSSYYDCGIQYPISIKPDDISIPTTVEERQRFKSEANIVRDELEQKTVRNALVISILVVFFILLVIHIVYITKIYPYARVRRKIRSED